jgi:L-iditol 2-dehydrogenase
MKAVYLTEPGRLRTHDVADPRLQGPNDVLLQLQAVGICGSDLHYFRTGRIGSQVLEAPWVMGHECTAVVREVGPEVDGVRPGDRVAVDPLIACGHCDQCRSGRKHTCRQQHFLGCPGQQQGCLCQWLVMPSDCCFPVPEQLSVGAAVLVEPFAIALHALHQLGTAEGKHIGVLGAGPIGLCVLAALQAAGTASVTMTTGGAAAIGPTLANSVLTCAVPRCASSASSDAHCSTKTNRVGSSRSRCRA